MLAPFYHLIYPDWEASVAWQGEALDAVIRAELGDGARTRAGRGGGHRHAGAGAGGAAATT